MAGLIKSLNITDAILSGFTVITMGAFPKMGKASGCVMCNEFPISRSRPGCKQEHNNNIIASYKVVIIIL